MDKMDVWQVLRNCVVKAARNKTSEGAFFRVFKTTPPLPYDCGPAAGTATRARVGAEPETTRPAATACCPEGAGTGVGATAGGGGGGAAARPPPPAAEVVGRCVPSSALMRASSSTLSVTNAAFMLS